MSIYDYESEIDEILDKALNDLNPEQYQSLLDHLDQMLVERQS